MKKLTVIYEGWGERWPLGTLADNGKDLIFEYSPEALTQGLELSPLHLKLSMRSYGDFPAFLQRLPGFIADALPDGWGLLLMDRLFRKNGLVPASVSPLDRLAFVSGNAMGALVFEPSTTDELRQEDIQLLDLSTQAQAIIAGHDSDALKKLAALGGSPQGARPKVLVHYNEHTGAMSTAPSVGSTPWLVKFQAKDEHKEVCVMEGLYAILAEKCGLEMPATRVFDLDKTHGAFGIARFDIEAGLRVPTQTLAALLHADFRVPGATDYATFLRATRALTRDEREVKKAYARAVFNVVFNNRDDHAKNVSFRLGRDRNWRLAPCYDLTFNEGPGGEHHMDICGEGKNITRTNLHALAKQGGLDTGWADIVIDQMINVANAFRDVAPRKGIRPATLEMVSGAINQNVKYLYLATGAL